MPRLSRRRAIALGAGVAATGAAAAGGLAVRASTRDALGAGIEPFTGEHQAGIATEQQDRLLFAAFDLTTGDRERLAALFRGWTAAAARLTAGLAVGGAAAHPAAPPEDTGEAAGLDPGRLTLTFGLGPGVFEAAGHDRFGLAARRPAALVDLPPFPGDALDPARSHGDLCVQACGTDPQVLYHAVRNLTRIARGSAVLRWVQEGFGRTSATTRGQSTPRNLMGFKDGTNNLRAGAPGFDEAVWVGAADSPAWMRGGSYLVARRIRMFIEVWDRTALAEQEQSIGRSKGEGAPLGREREFDAVDLDRRGADGMFEVPVASHIRIANQETSGIHFLRRGYSFTDGIDRRTGQLDAGLFFLAYQRDPRRQFIPMQDRLSRADALNEYIQHVGSAIFAIPPGVRQPGEFIGQALFA